MDFDELLKELIEDNKLPENILYLWPISDESMENNVLSSL